MNSLPQDVVNRIYDYIDCRNVHRKRMSQVCLDLDTNKRPWREFRAYWAGSVPGSDGCRYTVLLYLHLDLRPRNGMAPCIGKLGVLVRRLSI